MACSFRQIDVNLSSTGRSSRLLVSGPGFGSDCDGKLMCKVFVDRRPVDTQIAAPAEAAMARRSSPN